MNVRNPRGQRPDCVWNLHFLNTFQVGEQNGKSYFFPGALQSKLRRNFLKAMSLLGDSKKYLAAGALLL